MSIALKRFENKFRPAYEAVAAMSWSAAAFVMFFILVFTNLPRSAFFAMTTVSVVMAVWRWHQAFRLWEFRHKMTQAPFVKMGTPMLIKLMKAKPKSLWLGFGFDWTPVHTQRVHEIRKMDDKDIEPPALYQKIKGGAPNREEILGKPWIHGVNPEESQIYVPLFAIEGHNMIFGTTGSGKTRMFENLITQSVLRGSTVIIIDPKGDKDMQELAKAACELVGRPHAFLNFHPAFPEESIRLDPLKNWSSVAEVASRIAALLPSEGNASFTQMAWKAVHVVSEGLVYVGERPNLMKLRRYIEGGPEKIMEAVLRTYFERNVPNWDSMLSPLINRARDGKLPTKLQNASAELVAYAHYYRNSVADSMRETAVDGLLAMVEHNREHLGKILASLIPTLVMLTSDDLGKMLSPDPDDMNDKRPIFDLEKVIRGKYVLYVGLNSLSNPTVGAALGSAFLADLAAVCGARYNYMRPEEMLPIDLYVDEANECANDSLVQILNKARGSKVCATLATQTFPDFVVRLGSADKARQVMGNCNNLICLRSKDAETQKFVVETFGKTHVQTITRMQGAGQQTDNAGMDYRNQSSQSLGEQEADVFSPELLGMLPNLHYIGSFAGGRIIKGRIPKLVHVKEKG
jgi:conjugal transfer pilus assembly protein TraD